MTTARAPVGRAGTPARRTRWTDAELIAVDFPEPRWAVPGLLLFFRGERGGEFPMITYT